MTFRPVSRTRRDVGVLIGASLLAGSARAQPSASAGATPVSPVQVFYKARNGALAWSAPQRQALLESLGQADRHGLDSARYLRLIRSTGTPAQIDVSLSQAAISYADALAHGVVDPTKLGQTFTLERNRVDVVGGLQTALTSQGLKPWLSGLAPQDPEYQALSDAYVRQRGQPARSRASQIPGGPSVQPGGSDPRIPAIRARLARRKLLAAGSYDPASDANLYTPAMQAAIKALQAKAGLNADGVIGASTISALNLDTAGRARALALNLERCRWLARDPPARRIDVNTAACFLTFYRDASPAWETRVVVGRPDWKTPSLGAACRRLVVNPPWHVPDTIAKAEIFRKGRGYLRRHHMAVVHGQVIQKPGPDAALGQVKFDLDDPYAIYLHDTPAKAAFEFQARHRSHGCVRVQHALDLARMLAEDAGKAKAFDDDLASGKTHTVELGAALPVRLLYRTAYVSDGEVRYAPDAYGWDEDLARAMGLPSSGRKTTGAHADGTLGP